MSSISIRAGDTEPLEITVGATGVSNLDNVSSVVAYFRASGVATNHVDGASCTVSDSANMKVTLDPVGSASGGGDAFADSGTYTGYLLLTWADGDTTRHPGSDWLTVTAAPSFE